MKEQSVAAKLCDICHSCFRKELSRLTHLDGFNFWGVVKRSSPFDSVILVIVILL